MLIQNECAIPLVYALSVQASIAAQAVDIALDQRAGIIPPYRAKELVFSFRPTFTGAFSETLCIQNVFDRSNDTLVNELLFVYLREYFSKKNLFLLCDVGFVQGASAETASFSCHVNKQ